jgi:hypothetical protein
MTPLIPREQLEAARERHLRELAEASPATPATAAPTESEFVYQPRTVAQHNARIHQCSLGPGSTAETPKKSRRASPNSFCSACGHVCRLHCRRGRTHYAPDASTYWCNGSHCREIVGQGSCNCAGFTREPVRV